MHSYTEENYLKEIYKLWEKSKQAVATSSLAEVLGINAASVTDKLKKLSEKKLIHYQKSKGVLLTDKGNSVAIDIIRKHRLWEVFLVEKLGYGWDEVHEIAEQLEHIQSSSLTKRLDSMLGYPRFDPHGDPIPGPNGKFEKIKTVLLAELKQGSKCKFCGVAEHAPSFLKYLDNLGLSIGDTIQVKSIEVFDKTYHVILKGKKETALSRKVTESLLVLEI